MPWIKWFKLLRSPHALTLKTLGWNREDAEERVVQWYYEFDLSLSTIGRTIGSSSAAAPPPPVAEEFAEDDPDILELLALNDRATDDETGPVVREVVSPFERLEAPRSTWLRRT